MLLGFGRLFLGLAMTGFVLFVIYGVIESHALDGLAVGPPSVLLGAMFALYCLVSAFRWGGLREAGTNWRRVDRDAQRASNRSASAAARKYRESEKRYAAARKDAAKRAR